MTKQNINSDGVNVKESSTCMKSSQLWLILFVLGMGSEKEKDTFKT